MISSFQLALHGATLSLPSSPNQNNNTPYPSDDAVPCFASRINYHPRCLQRKKLIAKSMKCYEAINQAND
ncbi:hypothetical protein CFP56_029421 [Quercus suber]|uniref:Uncharacterized protein n=1 Tax=Quercus suber TaxID=58331 RepID=A0AAW0JTS2_QUESU